MADGLITQTNKDSFEATTNTQNEIVNKEEEVLSLSSFQRINNHSYSRYGLSKNLTHSDIRTMLKSIENRLSN